MVGVERVMEDAAYPGFGVLAGVFAEGTIMTKPGNRSGHCVVFLLHDVLSMRTPVETGQ
jgi:hypothetical protein